MTDINCVTLIGRLTADAVYSVIPSGMGVCTFSVANGKSYKKGDEWVEDTSFFECVFFSKFAEDKAKKLKKGTRVAVNGSLKQDRWEKDGQKFSKVKINVTEVEDLTPASSGEQKMNPKNPKTSVKPEDVADAMDGEIIF